MMPILDLKYFEILVHRMNTKLTVILNYGNKLFFNDIPSKILSNVDWNSLKMQLLKKSTLLNNNNGIV